MCLCILIQRISYNSNGDISLTAIKDTIILINPLHLKFRSVSCLNIKKHKKALKKTYQKYLSGGLLKGIVHTKCCDGSHIDNYSIRKSIYYQQLIPLQSICSLVSAATVQKDFYI